MARSQGSRTVTSRDVANAAGVSQSLVSLILSDKPGKKIRPETRALVMEKAAELGYRPNLQARAMKLRKARTIGFLSTWETGSFVFPPVINGLKAVCDREGLALMICTGRIDSTGLPDHVAYYLENRLDGLVYLAHVGVERKGVIESLERHNIPFSVAVGAKDLPGVSSVDVDFVANGRIAAEHLLASGCRHPACAIQPDFNYAEQERLEGFVSAFREVGIEPLVLVPHLPGEEQDALCRRFRQVLNDRPELDGFCAVTYLSWQMIEAAKAEGWAVPGRLKVISIDNEMYAPYLSPSLSTVDEPLEAIGRTAGDMLLQRMEGHAGGEKVELPPSITVRASTGG